MHDTAYRTGGLAMQLYCDLASAEILEIGSQNVNGTLRDFVLPTTHYVGLDIEAGEGVDVLMEPGKPFPVADESFDLVMATSVFEHDPAFWSTFVEMCRKAKPSGYIYVNAPSNGLFHQYPQDHWRFYPDCGLALVDWAKSQGQEISLVETFVAEREGVMWNDFVGIFRKGPLADDLPPRLVSEAVPSTNVRTWRSGGIERRHDETEDMRLLQGAQQKVASLEMTLTQLQEEIAQTQRLNAEIENSLDETLKENQKLVEDLDRCFQEIAALTTLLRNEEYATKRVEDQLTWTRKATSVVLNGSNRPMDKIIGLLPAILIHNQRMGRLKKKGLFDRKAYVAEYSDVASSGMDPLRHYILHGLKEGRRAV